MMIRLAYGKRGLETTLPDEWDVTVVEPKFVPGLPDPQAAIKQALRAPIESSPLRDLAKPDDKVAIIFSDITRPTPNHVILPPILAELSHIPQESITLFNAATSWLTGIESCRTMPLTPQLR
jgi:nickel-dependent lactate racemase